MQISPFQSFWMAGYECADQINKYGERVDLLTATNHIHQIEADYKLLETFGIKTVREGIRWSVVEYAPYHYNWEAVAFMLNKGKELGVQQIWDICHFGYPADLTPLHPRFSKRFEQICVSFVKLFRSIDPHATIFITPINEVSFLSWLGGDVAGTSPFCVRQGWEVKYHLMKAYITAVAAMKAMDANVVVISTEPLVNIVPGEFSNTEDRLQAARQHEEQFQAIDMLVGRICPELGGKPEYLDIIGVNFYYSNQWIYGTTTSLPWASHDRHSEWRPLSNLIEDVYHRYHKPIVITETSHPGEDRGLWIEEVGEECLRVMEGAVPLLGICIYPIIDRPDWDEPHFWHQSGLWGVDVRAPESSHRILNTPFATALLDVQQAMERQIRIAESALATELTRSNDSGNPRLAQDFLVTIINDIDMNGNVQNLELSDTRVNDFPEIIVCFSHLRWDFVFQRPQHLLTNMAEGAVVYYIEEPIHDSSQAHYVFHKKGENIIVVVPHLPANLTDTETTSILKLLLDELVRDIDLNKTAFWYYTPMALKFSRHLKPQITIFDCMDELSAFKFAPQELKDLEQELLDAAEIVFVGGSSLYEAKKKRHNNIHLFPSSIDKAHFGKARSATQEPEDQLNIPHPRLGFFGVIDERFDADLIRGIAETRPDWQLIMIGPVVKIDPATLPQRENIHYLGSKNYSVLPDYLSGWDIALISFALNESTRFISPTKTPEYLAAGVPVISTPLMDVIEPYARLGLVHVAANADGFIAASEKILAAAGDRDQWLTEVDRYLKHMSWRDTCNQMKQQIATALQYKFQLTAVAS